MKVTKDELAKHYVEGIGNECLVCEGELIGFWTDYNGQIRCCRCGTTYQILGDHLSAECKAELGLSAAPIAKRYCDVFDLVPMLRDYWNTTAKMVPLGSYFGSDCPITVDQQTSFYSWMARNASTWRVSTEELFQWDRILESFPAEALAAAKD